MRFPIILALAVIVLTPVDIRDVVHELSARAGAAVGGWLQSEPVPVVAAVSSSVASPNAEAGPAAQ